MRTYSVLFMPQKKLVSAKQGETLLDIALGAGIAVNAVCGGEGICGKCKMRVVKGSVNKAFLGKLKPEERAEGYVLACATRIAGDAEIEIPQATSGRMKSEESIDAERFAVEGTELEGFGNHPLVKKFFLTLDRPTLENNGADCDRLADAVQRLTGIPHARFRIDTIRSLPQILRSADFSVTVSMGYLPNGFEILAVEPGNTESENYILIIDVGTTTVVAHLVDSRSAKTIASSACFNSQSSYGAEVTSRIISAEKKGIGNLTKAIIIDINTLINKIIEEKKIDSGNISAVVLAGNTVMNHFLYGLPVENIRRNPYIPASVELPPSYAQELGLDINRNALCLSVPGISGWVGGDITAGILFTGMHRKKELSMLVDIGTNGEIVVGCSEWLIATSASAGPALEGANIECGIRAEAGAIDRVFLENGTVGYSTIGGAPAKGI
jgi:uncharacterized 2Fe-2S/4Fe-4S cluster protein (DUF4445 family)